MTARQLGWGEARPADRGPRSRPIARLVRGLKAVSVALALTAGSIGAYWGILQYEGNLHAVSEGVLYRSAQLSKAEIGSAARTYGIKSMLNLRGAHTGQAWYDDEIAASGELGIAHYDYPLSAKRLVTGGQIADILDIVRRAPKPLLIHCRSGADRSGLVAALYRFAETGASPAEADRELSLIYGHFPYLTSRTRAMDDSFWAFVAEKARSSAR
jgi:protein tyrosine/serine phosphatase